MELVKTFLPKDYATFKVAFKHMETNGFIKTDVFITEELKTIRIAYFEDGTVIDSRKGNFVEKFYRKIYNKVYND